MWQKRRTRSKYGNKKVEDSAGRSFGSKGEYECFGLLTLMEKAGEIRIVKQQDHVYLSAAQIEYIPDFKIIDLKGGRMRETWVEYKGFETPEWKLKLRLWQHYGPGPLWIYQGYGIRMNRTKVVEPYMAV